jgi:PhnB protein
MKDAPADPQGPQLTTAERNMVMHVALPILGGHMLMGTDMIASMGHMLVPGNNVSLNLEPDTRAETQRLFAALSEGGKVDMPLMDMFWGSYFGSVTDKFGIHWMFNCTGK